MFKYSLPFTGVDYFYRYSYVTSKSFYYFIMHLSSETSHSQHHPVQRYIFLGHVRSATLKININYLFSAVIAICCSCINLKDLNFSLQAVVFKSVLKLVHPYALNRKGKGRGDIVYVIQFFL